MKKSKKIFFLILLCFTSTVFSQSKFEKIDQYLNYLYEKDKFMGSLCIREGDKIVFNKAYGFADVEKSSKADTNTKYKIGSITKTFTAVMIFQLIDEKKLRLETRLHKFYPKVAKADSISIADLLYQRSGLPDYLNHDSLFKADFNSPNIKETILKKLENYKLRFNVGTQFEYSNSNYFLLGGILEKVTGKSYAENLEERISKKLNLKETYYISRFVAAGKNEAYSYLFLDDKWSLHPEWPNDSAFAAGGIQATPADVSHFMYELFNGKLISKKSLAQMTTIKNGYGAALMQAPFGDRKFYTHTGGIENFRSVVGYNSSDKLGLTLIVNGDNYSRNDIMIGVLSMYYKMPFPFPTFKKITPELVKKYSGNYSSEQMPLKLKVFEKNGELQAQATGQSAFPLTMLADDTFIFSSAGIEINFKENSLLLKQGGMKFLFVKE